MLDLTALIKITLKLSVSVYTNLYIYSEKKHNIGIIQAIEKIALKSADDIGLSKSGNGLNTNFDTIMKIEAGIRMAEKCCFQFGVLKSNKIYVSSPTTMITRLGNLIIFINIESIKANGTARRSLFKNSDILDFHE